MQAMTFLSQAGKVDLKRALILRTASDYCLPKPGVTSAQSLQYGTTNAYMAEDEAFESAYVVGSVVVRQLLADWPRYKNKVPSAPAP
jgi:purine nucleoside permease